MDRILETSMVEGDEAHHDDLLELSESVLLLVGGGQGDICLG